MAFTDAQAYDAFMGRYSVPLAPLLADFAGVTGGQEVLDVGCGTGALTGELVRRAGAASVSACDPSEGFVASMRARYPEVGVRQASAEELPFDAGRFDATLAQLVVHFMADPVAGLAEMARVTKPEGVVAACVWDHAGGQGPLSAFWRAARELDLSAPDESSLPGVREGHLAELMSSAGLRDVVEGTLVIEVPHATFEEWWDPYTRGVGPAGAFVARLSPDDRDALRELCRRELPDEPFSLRAAAWASRGSA